MICGERGGKFSSAAEVSVQGAAGCETSNHELLILGVVVEGGADSNDLAVIRIRRRAARVVDGEAVAAFLIGQANHLGAAVSKTAIERAIGVVSRHRHITIETSTDSYRNAED